MSQGTTIKIKENFGELKFWNKDDKIFYIREQIPIHSGTKLRTTGNKNYKNSGTKQKSREKFTKI
jgi:hypothetical protein